MLPLGFELSCGKSVKYRFIEFFETRIPFRIYFHCFVVGGYFLVEVPCLSVNVFVRPVDNDALVVLSWGAGTAQNLASGTLA